MIIYKQKKLTVFNIIYLSLLRKIGSKIYKDCKYLQNYINTALQQA